MIELTKQQLDGFLTNFSLNDQLGSIIITRQVIKLGSNRIASGLHAADFSQILAFRENDFKYTTPIMSNLYASIGSGIEDDSTGMVLNCAQTSLDNKTIYVIYVVSNGGFDGSNLFDNVDLVSVDYVGYKIMTLSFNTRYPNLEEINVYNGGRLGIKSLYDSIKLDEGQYIYTGVNYGDEASNNWSRFSFAPGAFKGSKIKKLLLPPVINIPDELCADCTDLLEVACAAAITSIGRNAFKGCTNLRSFDIHAGNGIINGPLTIGDGAFDGCVSLTDINMPYGDPASQINCYFGVRGCIMKKELINGSVKLSIFFANNYFWDGVINNNPQCGYVLSDLAYSTNKLYPSSWTSNNLAPKPGMYRIASVSGNYQISDFINNLGPYTCDIVVTQSNVNDVIASLVDEPVGKVGGRFLIPLCFFVEEIMPNACADNTTITNLDLSNFFSLNKIGDNAFKGCTGITSINFGPVGQEWGYGEMRIGVSAFEKCTGFDTLDVTRKLVYSNKAFFGCSNLAYVNFRNFAGSETLFPQSNNDNFPDLLFGNTPSLTSITADFTHVTLVAHNGNTSYNAIINGATSGTATKIMTGCKSTNFDGIREQYEIFIVGKNAFYGCTSLIIDSSTNSDALNNFTQIEDSAFYGCTGINSKPANKIKIKALSNIGPNAFYGCTNLECLDFTYGEGSSAISVSIGAKAFANSGAKYILVGNAPYVAAIADDAFENCVLSDVQVSQDVNNSMLRLSDSNVENSLLKRTVNNGSDVSILKSGDGRDIVNTDYNNVNKPIVEIKSNAFTGVTMSNEDNTTIHIPQSVSTLGKNIISGSRLNELDGSGSLVLHGKTGTSNPNCISGDTEHEGLLYSVGAKYFRDLIDKTYPNRQSYHYYEIEGSELADNGISLVEYSGATHATRKVVFELFYDGDGNMVLTIYETPDLNFAAQDINSHVTTLEQSVSLVLMYAKQCYNSNEQYIYCDHDILPGRIWNGISIPEVNIDSKMEYDDYTSLGSSFANCSWVDNVTSSKKLNNLIDGFSGCTTLTTIKAGDMQDSGRIDYNLFDGVVPSGIFSGCTNFTGISSSRNSNVVYPIHYGKKSFYKCKALNADTINSLRLATNFGEESFAETNLVSIDLMSALYIDETAFKSCNLTTAKATNTTGRYFTGAGGNCIVDDHGVIVVGTPSVDVDSNCTGIGNYAFYGRKLSGKSWGVRPTGKNGFVVGKYAFTESNIAQYIETNCVYSIIDEGAFNGCTSLTTVTFNGANSNVTLRKKAFMGCTALNSLTLPKGTKIPESSFSNCSSLASVTISGDVDKAAFENCTSLNTVNFSYESGISTAKIDPTAFKSCPISKFTFNNSSSGATLNYNFTTHTISRWNNEGHLELVLGTNDFTYYTEMDNYRNLKIIGDHAYNGRGLTGDIKIPGSVTKIGNYAFANNPGITRVFIPPTVEYIGDHAFDGCTNLKRVVLPDEICYIGEGVLKGCNLTEGLNCNYEDYRNLGTRSGISAPLSPVGTSGFNSVLDLRNTPITSISASAFEGSGIRAIHLPSDSEFTFIGNSAFKNCHFLTALYFHTSNQVYTAKPTLKGDCFYGCDNLSDIYIYSTYCWPALEDVTYGLGQVGQAVPAGKRHVHIPSVLYTYFVNSDFWAVLNNDLGFTIIQDL